MKANKNRPEICIIIGTRPELIKIAPIIFELENQKIDYFIVNTAQHKELLSPYWKIFNIKPNFSLDVMKPNQSLPSLTANLFIQLENLFHSIDKNISLIMAQGDTTTVMVSSMLAFYNKIQFAHIEAGLRSYNLKNPFPEEFNRKVASISTKFHFAPTKKAVNNLILEGINKKDIYLTGNTVVDSLEYIVNQKKFQSKKVSLPTLQKLEKNKTILITCHRRENQGENLEKIILAIKKLTTIYNKYTFVWSLHPNPNVKDVVLKSSLTDIANCLLIEPIDYIDLLKLIDLSKFIITDSGGIQEEAPSFKKPLIILRETTERPEGVDLGISKLCGTSEKKIIAAAKWADNYHFTNKQNPYGNGDAAKKIVIVIRKHLK